jgi:hypothetical protein
LGGPGTGIGGSNGPPVWLSPARGGVLGVICGYGVGVGVPGAPGTGVNGRGCCGPAASARGVSVSSAAKIAWNIGNLLSGTFLQAMPILSFLPVRQRYRRARLDGITVIRLIRKKVTP